MEKTLVELRLLLPNLPHSASHFLLVLGLSSRRDPSGFHHGLCERGSPTAAGSSASPSRPGIFAE